MQLSKQLKRELAGAAVAVIFAAVSLCVATYAWYVANNSVKATTSTISATTNGFILQIATKKQGAQHGGEQSSLAASLEGGKIAPSSTGDIKDWYVCQGWGPDGKVASYSQVAFNEGGKPGEYGSDSDKHYAFLKSEFIVYTISETGFADVYLAPSSESPIQITTHGVPTTDTIPKSLRVGITTQSAGTSGQGEGDETLGVVYAPYEVSGKGNDASAIDGWSCINGAGDPVVPDYSHIEADNLGKWAAVKSTDGNDYSAPDDGSPIVKNVGYDGVIVRIYIWMEGTDADCVNNAAAEDTATYDVSVKFAGVATS